MAPAEVFPSPAPGTGFGPPPSSGFFGRAVGWRGLGLGRPRNRSLQKFSSDLVISPSSTPGELPNGSLIRWP
ncbi:unnamed protein product [Prunus armeniaca]